MQPGMSKGRVILFITMPPSEEDRVQAALRLALIASSQGYEAIIYLALYSDAMNAGVRIVACKVAMQGFNVNDKELMNGIAIWEPKDLFESAKGSILISM